MSVNGTAAYRPPIVGPPVPDRVRAAVEAAVELGFAFCVRPEIGRLLQVLAAGVPAGGRIGEAGTGTGAGLGWLASTAHPEVEIVSFEIEPGRAAAARDVMAGRSGVEVITGDSAGLADLGPFDLLVLDGGPGSGKGPGSQPVDPERVLTPGGTLTVDDFTPATEWPPLFEGEPDHARMHWLEHPRLHTTEIRVAPDLAVLVGRRHGGG